MLVFPLSFLISKYLVDITTLFLFIELNLIPPIFSDIFVI
nr:MAG TPA: hypothetical protein [Crassvirales sp.]